MSLSAAGGLAISMLRTTFGGSTTDRLTSGAIAGVGVFIGGDFILTEFLDVPVDERVRDVRA